MARGIADKKIIDAFLKEFLDGTEFLQTIIPCIIPASEEDGEKLANGLKVIRQINAFIRDCDGDIGKLDELFDTDKIVEEYPELEKAFRTNASFCIGGDDVVEKYRSYDGVEEDDFGD